MTDQITRREALPSLGLLDLEKVKRETSGYSHHSAPVMSMPAPPLASPSTTYSGPPPPYSYPSSASSSVVGGRDGTHGGHTHGSFSSQTRQSSGDDKEHHYQPIHPPLKHTLPPITEALSISGLLTTTAAPKSSYPAQSPPSPVQRHEPELSRPRHEAYRPPTPKESNNNDTHRPSMHAFSPQMNNSHTFPSYSSFPYPPTSLSQPSRIATEATPYTRPSISSISQQSQISPVSAHPPYQRNESNLPQISPTYPYQQAYSYPPTTPGVPSYQSPLFDNRVNGSNPDQERAEEIRKAIPKDSPPNRPAYGEYVKRHLDIFDLETSLNEIAEGSGRALEFARVYGTHAHHTARSGPLPGSLPSLVDCDDMIRQQTRVLESMSRIRDVILKQQQALAEQKRYDQQNYKSSPDRMEHSDGHNFSNSGEGGGGFAGPDSKKRRGRAAPPGRCHSCNRAETPEWRRGPDGARTLCNACGLHYAKVTRKMGNKANGASSNLRPKDDPASP